MRTTKPASGLRHGSRQSPFATLEEVHRSLHGDTEPPADTQKADKRGLPAHIAGMRKLTQKLWGEHTGHSNAVSQDGSIAAKFGVASEDQGSKKLSRRRTGAALYYKCLLYTYDAAAE